MITEQDPWDWDQYVGGDYETDGVEQPYALQPWRIVQGKAWATSLAWVWRDKGQTFVDGHTMPQKITTARMIEFVMDTKRVLVGWNLAFDLAVMMALGFVKEAHRLPVLDGMLVWRHLEIEPEYEMSAPSKKSYSLKTAVREFIPGHAGYEDGIIYHNPNAEELKKLHAYNVKDNVFALKLTAAFYRKLRPAQRRALWIEQASLSMVAEANLKGMRIDTLQSAYLRADMDRVAAKNLAILAPHGVTEEVVRSPAKLSKLMFDDWGLDVLKLNKSKKKKDANGKALTTRSTDKSVLHELAFMDPRAKQVRDYREALNLKTKFAVATARAADYCGDGQAHPIARVFGTYCVPGDVEVLTRQGWVRLDQWGGGDIVQVRPDLTMEFLPATQQDQGVATEWVAVPKLRCRFTPEHTMPYLTQKTFQWRVQKAREWIGSGEVKYVPVAGYLRITGQYTPDQMRLFAATQADGYSTERYLKFTFVKQRKTERLVGLLTRLNIQHNVREQSVVGYSDRTEITIAKSYRPDWLGHDKKTLGPWLFDTTQEGLAAFIDELVHWDGSSHVNGGVVYSSTIQSNLEWVTTVAALVGRKAQAHKRMTAHISNELPHRAVLPRSNRVVVDEAHAYCPSTETGFWLARSQGRIFVTGNTSRMTYSSSQGKGKHNTFPIGFAIHQMKNDPEFRGQLIAPEGYTIVEWDAAGQEFKWMAIASKDHTMLNLCQPGQDAHSYMTSRIYGLDYQQCLAWHQAEDKAFKAKRKMGKVGNLCIAKGEIVLTDRGPCSIELVKSDDLVWDGEAFVAHDGVSFSGERWTIDNDGVMATPSHQVLVSGAWTAHDETQRMGWAIDRACAPRHALRIVGGIARRAVREAWRDLRAGALRLWDRARSQPAVHGDRTINHVQGLRYALATSAEWRPDRDRRGDATLAEASQRMVSTMLEPEGSLMAKLWGAWDRVSVLISGGSRGIRQTNSAASHVPQTRHRPARQRGSLRAWKLALGYAQSEPRKSAQVETYDIVNCGPRTRYAINGRIVHNSLQYRTSAKKFRVVARVDYDIPMTTEESVLIHRTYPKTYPGVPIYWQAQIAITQTKGYVETFAGRRVKVVGDWSGPFGWNMGSTSINYKIQGTGGDQKYLAMQHLKDYLPSVDGRFMLDMHDGLYALIPDRYAEKAAFEGKDILDNLPYGSAWNFIPPVPLNFDVKLGRSWGALHQLT